jgi:hypothetical protein
MYGKDNRILYSARFSKGFKVVAVKRTRQAAGVSSDGAKIRVTDAKRPWRRRIGAEGAMKAMRLRQR